MIPVWRPPTAQNPETAAQVCELVVRDRQIALIWRIDCTLTGTRFVSFFRKAWGVEEDLHDSPPLWFTDKQQESHGL